MLSLKLAWKAMRARPTWVSLFVLNLTLGFLGFFLLENFRAVFVHALEVRSRELLGADLSVRVRRAFSKEEREGVTDLLKLATDRAEMTEFLTMVATKDRSRLGRVRAVTGGFPFYGIVRSLSGKELKLNPVLPGTVWVSPELMEQLGAKVGEKITLGTLSLTISEELSEDLGSGARFADFAPVLYLSVEDVKASKLLREGSLFFEHLFFKLPPDATLPVLEQKLAERLTDPAIHIQSHRTAAEDNARFLGTISDFLSLMALVAFFLAGVGIAYFFLSLLNQEMKTIATFVAVGLSQRQVVAVYSWILSVTLVLGVLAASLLSRLFLPLFSVALRELLPSVDTPHASMQSLWAATGMATLALGTIVVPLLFKLREVRPATLFQEESETVLRIDRKTLLRYFPALLLLWGSAFWQARSLTIANGFVLVFLLTLLALLFVGWGLLRSLDVSLKRVGWKMKQAVLSLVRYPAPSLTCFVALSFSVWLVSFVGQMEASFQTELESPVGIQRPGFFLFDLQEEQVAPLEQFLGQQHVSLNHVSPYIRSRFISLNGLASGRATRKGLWETREEKESQGLRNRGFNLSYRTELIESETLVEGRLFTESFRGAGTPEISVERRFAKRLGWEMGDTVTFDVHGVKVDGKITSLRRIRWTSFQPNLFILFQPGVLESAPKTFLATLPPLLPETREALLRSLTVSFPNVTLIDIQRTTKKILDLAGGMSEALRFVVWLILLASFFVFFSVWNQRFEERRRAFSLYRILGMDQRSRVGVLALECAILVVSAGIFGIALSHLTGRWLASFLFEGLWEAGWWISGQAFILACGAGVTAFLVTVLRLRRALMPRPIGS